MTPKPVETKVIDGVEVRFCGNTAVTNPSMWTRLVERLKEDDPKVREYERLTDQPS